MSVPDTFDSTGTASLGFLEELFAQYQADPASVDPDWQRYFAALENGAPAPAASGPAAGQAQRPTAASLRAVVPAMDLSL
ncbi:MAG: hypothetical protein WCJ21_11200, partial [Planctomycetota bacterium]